MFYLFYFPYLEMLMFGVVIEIYLYSNKHMHLVRHHNNEESNLTRKCVEIIIYPGNAWAHRKYCQKSTSFYLYVLCIYIVFMNLLMLDSAFKYSGSLLQIFLKQGCGSELFIFNLEVVCAGLVVFLFQGNLSRGTSTLLQKLRMIVDVICYKKSSTPICNSIEI